MFRLPHMGRVYIICPYRKLRSVWAFCDVSATARYERVPGPSRSVHGPWNADGSACTVSWVRVYDLGVTVVFAILVGVIVALWGILLFGEDY